MRLIVPLVLVLGLTLAGLAVYMAQGQIGRYQTERDQLIEIVEKTPKLATVVVAKRALKYGERFTAEDLAIARVEADRLPKGTFRRITAKQGSEAAATAVFVEGETRPRAARRTYEENEPILSGKVTAPGVDAGIMAGLAPNMRAFTIEVDRTSGVSGFLRPGDRVDVYWSGSISDQPVTKLIQANLKLIAIDQSADADRAAQTQIARTVTVEVTPEEVAALTLAQATGQLTLALVGASDTTEIGAIEINRAQLLGIQTQRPRAAAPKVCTIRTRKGSEIIETQIPCTD